MASIVPADAAQVHRRTTSGSFPPPIVVLSFSPRRFALVWVTIALLRVLCICFFVSAGLLYLALESVPALEYYTKFVSPTYSTLYRPSSCIYLLFGAAHFYKLLQSSWISFRSRTLVFDNHLTISVFSDDSKLNQSASGLSCAGRRKHLSAYRFFFDRQGVFGAESPYFHALFLLREVFEMASQTVQVYLASFLIGRPWINHLYVAVFFVNSCSTAIIEHSAAHKSPSLERVLCLTADVLLDALMSIVVPALIIGPYVLQFDTETQSFPLTLVYSTVGFNRLIFESKQVLVHNWGDLVMKLIPHLSIYSCLNAIQSLIRPNITPICSSEVSIQTEASNEEHRKPMEIKLSLKPQSFLNERSSSVIATREMLFSSNLAERVRRMESQRLDRRKARLVHGMLLLWGAAIVFLHANATYKAINDKTTPTGCMNAIRPWMSSKFSCSVYKFNCSEHNVVTPSADSLAFLDELAVVALIFTHCPALEMPATIQHFPNLMGIDVWHSAIADWSESSALRSNYHPNMVYLVFLETNMSALPVGVLYDLPLQLGDIEISSSNLTDLPEDLGKRWPQVSTLFLEYCDFEVWPAALSHMNVFELSLIGNKLRTIPSFDDKDKGFVLLWMSDNPLEKLPKKAGSLSSLSVLALDDTNVASIPSWVTDRSSAREVFAFNTPYCASVAVGGLISPVLCSDVNIQRKGRYPADVVKAGW